MIASVIFSNMCNLHYSTVIAGSCHVMPLVYVVRRSTVQRTGTDLRNELFIKIQRALKF